MKKLFIIVIFIFIFIFIFILLIATGQKVFAQTASQSADEAARKYNITFPIVQLGNCTDLASCKIYCDDPNHQASCIAFAKEKGFYKAPDQSQIIQAAESELGCNSAESCKTFCSQEANYDKCSTFAKAHNLTGGKGKDPANNITLQQAKQILGCDSVDSCRAFCENPQNQQKCTDFAQQAGLKGGKQTVGPGGCTSKETCQAFCADPNNFQVCQQFTQSIASSSAQEHQQFKGPGGCMTQESCQAYCQKNPTVCNRLQSGLPPETPILSPYPSYSPTRPVYPSYNTPPSSNSGISQSDYCRLYPDRCISSYPSRPIAPTLYQSPSIQPTLSQDAKQAYCREQYGNACFWTGSRCSCAQVSTVSPRPSLPAYQYPSPTTTYYPAVYPSMPYPSQQVKGIATMPTFFQFLLTLFHFGK